jgi:hypothetical protein
MGRIDVIRERRKQARKSVKIVFLFKMGRLFTGRGFAKDINQSGMCLVCPALFNISRKLLLSDYIGSSLQVMVPAAGITINGVIAWVNLKKGEGGIKVTSTSDESRWQELCGKS